MLGSYADFIHNHDEQRKLNWSVGWDTDVPIALIDPIGKRTDAFSRGTSVKISGEVASVRGAPRARSVTYSFGKHSFSLVPKNSDDTAFDLVAEGDNFVFRRTQGRPWQLPGPVKSYGFPDQVRTYYQNSEFLADLVASFEEQMDKIFYLGPLREYPKREYTWSRSRPSDVGQKGDRFVEAILAATERGELLNLRPKTRLRPFQEIIAYWLRQMGLISSFRVEEIRKGSNLYQARVVVREGAPEVLLTDVGIGVSQVLPVLTLLYYVNEGATILLEQPEIHLHPLAQAALADVLASVAQHRRIQIIIENHSEHLLLRLQRRIAEQEIDSRLVKLYFAEAKGSSSELIDLKIDELGTIMNWPKNFMGDAVGELEETAKARIERLKSKKKK